MLAAPRRPARASLAGLVAVLALVAGCTGGDAAPDVTTTPTVDAATTVPAPTHDDRTS